MRVIGENLAHTTSPCCLIIFFISSISLLKLVIESIIIIYEHTFECKGWIWSGKHYHTHENERGGKEWMVELILR